MSTPQPSTASLDALLCGAHERVLAADASNPAVLARLAEEYRALQDGLVRFPQADTVAVRQALALQATLENKLRAGLVCAKHAVHGRNADAQQHIARAYQLLRGIFSDPVLEAQLATAPPGLGELERYRSELRSLFTQGASRNDRAVHERLVRIAELTDTVRRSVCEQTQSFARSVLSYVEASARDAKRELQLYAVRSLKENLSAPDGKDEARWHLADAVGIEHALNRIIARAQAPLIISSSGAEQLLVGFSCGTSCDAVARSLSAYGTVERLSLIDYVVLRSDAQTIASILHNQRQALGPDATIAYTPRTHSVTLVRAPSAQAGWNLDLVGAPEAWQKTHGSGIIVAVVDTGIDYRHPDLAERFGSVRGIGFVDGDCADDNGHGTHVAGTVAGAKTGVAPQCTLYAVKVLDMNGVGSEVDVLKGIEWSVLHGAQVINMSLGSRYASSAEAEMVAAAAKRGISVCCAAGNDGDGAYNYPASHDGAISVAAVDRQRHHASFSNHNDRVDLSAPGVSVFSTWPGGGYDSLSGTSMATPHVSGACALVRAAGTPAAESRLKATAAALGEAEYYGAGLIQLGRAVP